MTREIKSGQVWRRKSDGLLIRIVNARLFDGWTWRALEENKNGQIFDESLHKLYEFVREST